MNLLDCLSKNSAVAGLLQVTEATTLPILEEYCNERCCLILKYKELSSNIYN